MRRASLLLTALSLTLGHGVFAAGKLKTERARVYVDKVMVHGSIVHVDGWAALPATPDVAREFIKLKTRVEYECDAVYFEGATGWGSGTEGQLSPVQMVYELKGCSEITP